MNHPRVPLSCVLLATVLLGCTDEAKPDFNKCMVLKERGLFDEAIQACSDAASKSPNSELGKEATAALATIRELRAAESRRLEIERAATEANSTQAMEVHQDPEPQIMPRSDATAPELKTMKALAADVREIHKTCSAPRARGLNDICMRTLRESFASLKEMRAMMEAIPKSAAGYFDLGMAISLTQDCCDCAESDAHLCDEVGASLRTADAELRAARAVSSER